MDSESNGIMSQPINVPSFPTKRAEFVGLPLDCLSFAETLDLIETALEKGTRVQHCVINAGKVVAARKDLRLLKAISSSDIVNADGQAVVWMGRLGGLKIPERVAGIDLMDGVLRLASDRHLRVYLLGGTQHVVDRAAEAICLRHPGILALRTHHGYFGSPDPVLEDIREFKPDFLLVGMSTPRKELFIAENRDHLRARVMMGVGGAFDIWAGKTRRAPAWMQRTGSEWVYRVVQEPRRLWRRYLCSNVAFCVHGGAWALRRQVGGLRKR